MTEFELASLIVAIEIFIVLVGVKIILKFFMDNNKNGRNKNIS